MKHDHRGRRRCRRGRAADRRVEDIPAGSGLDWTVIRPPQLTGKPCRHLPDCLRPEPAGRLVRPRAAAHLMLRAGGQPLTIHQAIAIASQRE